MIFRVMLIAAVICVSAGCVPAQRTVAPAPEPNLEEMFRRAANPLPNVKAQTSINTSPVLSNGSGLVEEPASHTTYKRIHGSIGP